MDKPMLVSRGDGVQGFKPLGWCHASRVGLQEADSHHAPLALMDEKPEAAHWSVAAGNWPEPHTVVCRIERCSQAGLGDGHLEALE